jgi:hypothetical protein
VNLGEITLVLRLVGSIHLLKKLIINNNLKFNTMKNLFLISIIILLSNNCFAQKNHSENNKVHKLSYEEYMNQYGTDDTSKAIIEFFFDKREYSAAGKISFLPLSAAVTIAVPPIGIGLMTISSPLFISGLITRKKYNHKNLIKTLDNYQNNNLLSANIKKKVGQLMEAQEAIYNEELAEDRLATLKSIRQAGKQDKLISGINQ